MSPFFLQGRLAPVTVVLAFCITSGLAAPHPGAQDQTPPPTPPNSQQTPDNPKQPNDHGPIDERVKPAPSTPVAPSTAVSTSASPSGPGAPVDANSYKIGPADVLLIRVWNEPEFSGPVAVQENGKFTLPLIGDLQAGSETPNQVQEEVAKALTKYVVHPLVTVTVQDVGSKRYYMDGLINRPGEYPLVVPTTVLEAISKAGGVTEFANKKHIYVLRGAQRIPFNLKDVIHGKKMGQNILLKPGDYVVVN